VWDTETGKPLYNAIVWPDTRTKGLVRELKSRKGAEELQELCGLPLSTYPSSVKLRWLLENVETVRKAYDDGKLSFGTVDTWLLWHLNGGKANDVFVTDATNASRTMLMNLHTLEYDRKLLGFFELEQDKIQLYDLLVSKSHAAYFFPTSVYSTVFPSLSTDETLAWSSKKSKRFCQKFIASAIALILENLELIC
jgi:glycerol kinase